MEVRFYSAIEAIGQSVWNTICDIDYPFIRYEFLHALETAADPDKEHGAGCSRQSGWQAHHAVVYDKDNQPIAAAPMYLKYHSYGEYIFDWSWADAYQRNGLNYYPKLLAAIPYSPVTGLRIAIASSYTGNNDAIYQTLVDACKNECAQLDLSSCHFLFPEKSVSDTLKQQQLLQRHSHQYHWINQNKAGEPYTSFDDFLGEFKSRKRKDVKKERRLVAEQDVRLLRLTGADIDDDVWDVFYDFYQLTYAKRSGHGGYLPKAFFQTIAKTMPEQLLLVLAIQNDVAIAGALNLFSSTTLFGRYWGCTKAAEFLHFEACYYQGIEFCIERGLKKFDAGAQGEHKVQRGFRPVPTWSNHWIQHEGFRDAIQDFVVREAEQVKQNIAGTGKWLPFNNARFNNDSQFTDKD